MEDEIKMRDNMNQEIESVLNASDNNHQEIIDHLNDSILIKMTDMLELQRSQNSNTVELEIRIGLFNEGNVFIPGYNNITPIKRLIARLKNNGQQKNNWTTLDPVQFMDAIFGDVRKRIIPGNAPILCVKKKISTLDIGSDRIFGFRVSLSDEKVPTVDDIVRAFPKKTLTSMQECLKELSNEPPALIRYAQRQSFVQKIDFKNGFVVNLRYDISKVSCAKSKMDLTRTPASYHCEIELLDKLFKFGNIEEERQQSKMIAYVMLSQAKALLGTHKNQAEVYEVLPRPCLHFISQS